MNNLDPEKLSDREYFVRKNLSREEVLRRIQDYGAQPDFENKDLDIYDQLLACEAIAEAEEEQKKRKLNKSVRVSGNVNDTYKRNVNLKLSKNKLEIISKLRSYHYRTPIFEIANSLQELFEECQSKPGHWPYIAEHYTPKTINSVIAYMIKRHGNWKTLQNPAAYFTNVIHHHKQRKEFRNTSDTR